ncbi:MAG TPA: hypothetical protein VM143_15150 [Acidimicrobiales bacterium]|nr:hypothetical protein [Acidimicrobiales bacterium]
MTILNRLELELRRLPQVTFVGFAERGNTMVVQVQASPTSDADKLRRTAELHCESQLERPFVLELVGSQRPSRIRLVDVESALEDEVVVHLGFDGVYTSGRSRGTDPTAAAEATFEALQELGATVPFRLEAAALFEHVVGEGVMVVLGSDDAGQRYGVAGGTNTVQAAVRATLHALNRYLSTQPFAVAAAAS